MTDYEFEKAKVLKKKIEEVEEILSDLSVSYPIFKVYGDPGDGVTDYLFDIDTEAFNTLLDHYTNKLEVLKKEFEELCS